jgi:hypothetical protein
MMFNELRGLIQRKLVMKISGKILKDSQSIDVTIKSIVNTVKKLPKHRCYGKNKQVKIDDRTSEEKFSESFHL